MSQAAKRLRTLAALPTAERQLLLRAFTLLWLCRVALWLLPFSRVARWAERREVQVQPHLQPRAELKPRRIVRALRASSRFVPHATCLVKALAGARLFAEQGQRVQIIIGARKRAEVLEAHAWLEASGQVVLGNVTDLHSYHPLSRPEGF